MSAATFARRAVRDPVLALGDLVDRAVERAIGADTIDIIHLEELGIDAPGRQRYVVTHWLPLLRALRSVAPGPGDVVLDLGSGKGRAIVAACLFPIDRAIGIELSPDLAELSRENLARARGLRCRSAEVVVGDATTFDVPGDVTVVYAFNPFTGAPFAAAVERILASLDRHPRPLSLVYTNPVEHAHLLGTGRFRPRREIPGALPPAADAPLRIVTYDVV